MANKHNLLDMKMIENFTYGLTEALKSVCLYFGRLGLFAGLVWIECQT